MKNWWRWRKMWSNDGTTCTTKSASSRATMKSWRNPRRSISTSLPRSVMGGSGGMGMVVCRISVWVDNCVGGGGEEGGRRRGGGGAQITACHVYYLAMSWPIRLTGRYNPKTQTPQLKKSLRFTQCWGEPVWPSGKALSPFLIGRMFLREPSWKYPAKLVGS